MAANETVDALFPVSYYDPRSGAPPCVSATLPDVATGPSKGASSLSALNAAIRTRLHARRSDVGEHRPAKRQRAAATAPTLRRNASRQRVPLERVSASSKLAPPSFERSSGSFTSLLLARDLLTLKRAEPKQVTEVEEADEKEEHGSDFDSDCGSSSSSHTLLSDASAAPEITAAVRAAAELATEWCLLPELVDVVKQQELTTFFPIQRLAIEPIIRDGVRDACIAAPTGSGKTLVYVICVLNALARRVVVRTRALIVVPTRDLARQAHAVFTTWASALGASAAKEGGGSRGIVPLKPILLIGQSPFEVEQAQLVQRNAWGELEAGADIVIATPGRLVDHLTSTDGFSLEHLEWLVVDEADRLMSQNYQGWIERVMRASGRRVAGGGGGIDALARNASPGASGRGAAAQGVPRHCDASPLDIKTWRPHWQRTVFGESVDVLVDTAVAGYSSATWAKLSGAMPLGATAAASPLPAASLVVQRTPLRRILLSATLTQNPAKLSEFQLINPMRFAVNKRSVRDALQTRTEAKRARQAGEDARNESSELERRFVTPANLDEHMVVCSKGQKPLLLMYMLHAIQRDGALLRAEEAARYAAEAGDSASDRAVADRKCASAPLTMVFTGSVDSAHRLARLLQLYGAPSTAFHRSEGMAASMVSGTTDAAAAKKLNVNKWRVREFSSAVSQKERNSVISEMERGLVSVIVCSDSLARGIDLLHISTVINYDAPMFAATYVHRAGRTARAGRRGTVCTLLLKKQVWKFKSLLSEVDNNFVSKLRLPAHLTVPLVPRFVRCLDALRRVLMSEKHGKLRRNLMVSPISGGVADTALSRGRYEAVESATRRAWS